MEKLLEQVLQERYHKTIREASSQEIYTALLLIIKDKMKHMKRNEGKKKLYYISAEFLIGKLLSNNRSILVCLKRQERFWKRTVITLRILKRLNRSLLLETAALDVWHVFPGFYSNSGIER